MSTTTEEIASDIWMKLLTSGRLILSRSDNRSMFPSSGNILNTISPRC